MAKQGRLAGIGIAHRGNAEYLKSIPDGSKNNNLGNLPPFLQIIIPKFLTDSAPGERCRSFFTEVRIEYL